MPKTYKERLQIEKKIRAIANNNKNKTQGGPQWWKPTKKPSRNNFGQLKIV
jgi:hypothetical protein